MILGIQGSGGQAVQVVVNDDSADRAQGDQ